MEKKLLLVNNNSLSVHKSQRHLSPQGGYQIWEASCTIGTLKVMEHREVDVTISGSHMSHIPVSELLSRGSKSYLLISGFSDFNTTIRLDNEGAFHTFFHSDKPGEAVKSGLEKQVDQQGQRQAIYPLGLAIEDVLITGVNDDALPANSSKFSDSDFTKKVLERKNYFSHQITPQNTCDFLSIERSVVEKKVPSGSSKKRQANNRFALQPAVVKRREVSAADRIDDCSVRYIKNKMPPCAPMNDDGNRPHQNVVTSREFLKQARKRVSVALTANSEPAILACRIDQFDHATATMDRNCRTLLEQAVCLRLLDELPEMGHISPFGSGEFLLLIPSTVNDMKLEMLAERILKVFKSSFLVQDYELFLSLNIGLARYQKDTPSAERWIDNATRAAMKAKGSQHPIQFSHPGIDAELEEQLLLEQALYKAVRNEEFSLVFQPKLDLANGKVCGVEALIRWVHPTWGAISPVKFIPVAEKNGLIHKIGRYVIKQACHTLAFWQMNGFPDLTISVNLSPAQITDQLLPEFIENVMEVSGIQPGTLELEITESVQIIDGGDKILKFMRHMRSIGVNFAADDFGTGYSGLGYIKQFSFNVIKIDKSFIDDMLSDVNCKSIVISIIDLAKSLRLVVIAEGVESADQALFLHSMGCDQIQGYYFSKPLNEPDLTQLLSKRSIAEKAAGVR